ncbi:type II toxin-antitoxin system HicA family toxin [Candidatus Parvarchaeota archaeon]|nr:type II toxin-antitoxin system HicA family toxin [Candidatus Parvarchaeota archaeon]
MKPASGKEVVKLLQKLGFSFKRQKGSHLHLVKEVQGTVHHVTVPVHGNEDLNLFVLRSIARQAGYTAEEFSQLLIEK